MHNEYVGIVRGKNYGDIWIRNMDGKFHCSNRAFKLSEKAIINDTHLGYLKEVKPHRLIFLSENAICFVYDGQGYRITRQKWDSNPKLDDCWPRADCYIRIIGHIAVGIFQEFFDNCKHAVALA